MNLVFELQSTFLDVVRPSIKSQASNRPPVVMSPSLASLEDSVSSNFNIICDLGYYAGSGHEELAIESLKLLKKLASSRTLNTRQKDGTGVYTNRLVSVLQQNNDIDSITKSLTALMTSNAREISKGPEAPGYGIKLAVLDCFQEILKLAPNQANIAHVLLGFKCLGSNVTN